MQRQSASTFLRFSRKILASIAVLSLHVTQDFKILNKDKLLAAQDGNTEVQNDAQ